MSDHKFLRRIFSAKVLPSWTILLLDIAIVAVSVFIGYLLRFDFAYPIQHSSEVLIAIGCIVAVDLVFFRVFRTYANASRSFFISSLR